MKEETFTVGFTANMTEKEYKEYCQQKFNATEEFNKKKDKANNLLLVYGYNEKIFKRIE